MYDRPIRHQSRQDQSPDLRSNPHLLAPGWDRGLAPALAHAVPRFPWVGPGGQRTSLRGEVVVDQIEDTPREKIDRGIEIASVPGTPRQSGLREAMIGDVPQRRSQDGTFKRAEGTRSWIIFIRMIASPTNRAQGPPRGVVMVVRHTEGAESGPPSTRQHCARHDIRMRRDEGYSLLGKKCIRPGGNLYAS